MVRAAATSTVTLMIPLESLLISARWPYVYVVYSLIPLEGS